MSEVHLEKRFQLLRGGIMDMTLETGILQFS